MKQYHRALLDVLVNGSDRPDRTGVGVRSLFGLQMRFNLQAGFPAVTTKRLAWRSVVSELLWFIEGSSDERRLAEILHGTRDPERRTIWTANAQADYWRPRALFDGDIGRVYGVQWRSWGPRLGDRVDQLAQLIQGIRQDPHSRRHILTAWNPGELDDMALPPCHVMSQFYVNDGRLSCQMYQRSADMFLGVPFNIASYALFTHMIAHCCDLSVGDFVHVIGDAHIYSNHFDQVRQQLDRDEFPLPRLEITYPGREIDEIQMDHIRLVDYQSHPAIAADMAV
jgi:thymidylate synthase